MQPIIDALREVLGTPDFYLDNGVYDYGAMLEYIVGAVLLVIVVSSVFKIVRAFVKR